MTVKERLHQAIDAMTEAEAAEALRTLGGPRDPAARFFAEAPLDDEPFTAADVAAVAEADADEAAGRMGSWDDLRSELA